MRKVLVVLVVLLAVIVPPLTASADEYSDRVYNDPVMQARLERVGARVVEGVHKMHPDYKGKLRFFVYDDEDLNAFALPDGRIFVHKGMMEALANRPDGLLAGLLNHEATHVAEKHGKKQVKKGLLWRVGTLVVGRALGLGKDTANTASALTTGVVIGHYSREKENAADNGSVDLNALEGYDPEAPADVMEMLLAKYGNGNANTPGIGWFAGHPDTAGRIKAMRSQAAKYKQSGKKQVAERQIGQVGTTNHLEMRRVFVRFEFAGDSYRLNDWFPQYFQMKVVESGQVEIEAWDQDWDTVTEAQDRINDSGRYSKETRRQVPKGQMHAPTDYYQITVNSAVKRLNVGANVGGYGRSAGASVQDYVSLKLDLYVQPWDIRTGRLQPGWHASGSAKGLDGVNAYYSGGWRGQNFNVYISDIEKTLEGKAAKKAVEDFLKQFSPTAPEITVESATGRLTLVTERGARIGINIVTGKELSWGSQIVFFDKKGNTIAKYRVVKIDGQNVSVETELEKVRPTAERFKIM